MMGRFTFVFDAMGVLSFPSAAAHSYAEFAASAQLGNDAFNASLVDGFDSLGAHLQCDESVQRRYPIALALQVRLEAATRLPVRVRHGVAETDVCS